MTDEAREDELSGVLAESVASLREEIEVRPDWLAQLLARVDADRTRSSGWRMRPSLAVAAGIALLVAGAAIGRLTQTTSSQAAVSGNVRFVFAAPGAARVSVVGDFNHW